MESNAPVDGVVEENSHEQDVHFELEGAVDDEVLGVCGEDHQASGDGKEDMSRWESQGKPLEGRAVVVEGRKVADRVIAIVQPVDAVRKQVRQESKSMFSE